VQRLKELGAQFAEPWRSAASNISDDAEIPLDQGVSWDPRKVFTVVEDESTKIKKNLWNGNHYNGLATLAGDAAHTMLPRKSHETTYSRILHSLFLLLDTCNCVGLAILHRAVPRIILL
jgi:hypothetical protein